MAAINNNDNVLVMIYQDSCPTCSKIKDAFHQYEEAIRAANIGVSVVRVKTPIDENIHPKDLVRFSERTPTLLLVRGDVWSTATNKANLGRNNPIKFDSSVGLDLEIEDSKVVRPPGNSISIDVKNTDQVVKWVKEVGIPKLISRQKTMSIAKPNLPPQQPASSLPQYCSNIEVISKRY